MRQYFPKRHGGTGGDLSFALADTGNRGREFVVRTLPAREDHPRPSPKLGGGVADVGGVRHFRESWRTASPHPFDCRRGRWSDHRPAGHEGDGRSHSAGKVFDSGGCSASFPAGETARGCYTAGASLINPTRGSRDAPHPRESIPT